jgi:hypothetical protein
MAEAIVETGTTPAPMGLLPRFVGIVTSPADTYRAAVAHPRWLGMLALVTLIMMLGTALPMTTEAGQQAAIDAQVRQMESIGFQVNDQMYEGMQRGAGRMAYTTAAGVLVMSPIMSLIIALILWVVFTAVMGGTASFKQAFTVVVHAGAITALSVAFIAPLNVLRGEMTTAANLGVLLPMLEPGSFMARLAGMIDVFTIWWVVVLAIGLGVLYRRKTSSIATGLFAVYAVIALGLAAVMSRFGGGQ